VLVSSRLFLDPFPTDLIRGGVPEIVEETGLIAGHPLENQT